MQISKNFLIASLVLLTFSCKGSASKAKKDDKTIPKIENQKLAGSTTTDRESNNTFTISCGSGCAMTYWAESITGSNERKKVKFKVETYIDGALSETNKEAYIFFYNRSNQIVKIQREGEGENILETLLPDAVESFKEFAYSLVKPPKQTIISEKSNDQSGERLPYNKKINVNTVSYKKLNEKSIKGISRFICNSDNPRYLPLPRKEDIDVILVPQDCGDFNYRFYLLTVKNGAVVGDLYVEGEWYEPGEEKYKEVTSFSIDNQYSITVTTKASDQSINKKYIIDNSGKIREMRRFAEITN